MKDILPDLLAWVNKGESIALATVVQTWGSSPRGVGARMGITADGRMTGSVSGGCVEGAVIEAGMEVIRTGQPQLLHFGVADETAWEVGLACGGSIEVFVQPLDLQVFMAMRKALEAETPAAVATIIRGPDHLLGQSLVYTNQAPAPSPTPWPQDALSAAQAALAQARPARHPLPDGQTEVFVDVLLPPPSLIIVGGVHISIALAKIAKVLGYQTTIVDPRRAFGNPERFSHADQLVQAWPDEALRSLPISRSTAIAVLTHDPKLDDPALIIALASPAFYVGALGSKTTQAKRRARLLQAGLAETQVDRLHGPIGLDIGAQTPEEIALSIMGEVVAAGKG